MTLGWKLGGSAVLLPPVFTYGIRVEGVQLQLPHNLRIAACSARSQTAQAYHHLPSIAEESCQAHWNPEMPIMPTFTCIFDPPRELLTCLLDALW